jgi:hypothetical protein
VTSCLKLLDSISSLLSKYGDKTKEALSEEQIIEIGMGLREIGDLMEMVMLLKVATEYVDRYPLGQMDSFRNSHRKVDLEILGAQVAQMGNFNLLVETL